MIKTFLKHKIAEMCIDTVFGGLTDNFPKMIDGKQGYKLLDGHTYEFVSFIKDYRKFPKGGEKLEIWHLYNACVYKRTHLNGLGEMVKVVSSTAICTSYDKNYNETGSYVVHNDDMYISETWITSVR